MNWMGLLIGLLTFILVVDCLLLGLLILIQLPKKEAGLGTAFGSGATDALFGAGTGTALTKMTRYAASGFLLLALTLSVMHNHRARAAGRILSPEEIARRAQAAAAAPGPGTPSNAVQSLAPLTLTNLAPQATVTNAPTNASPSTPAETSAPPQVETTAPPAATQPEDK